tara:strand:+ start:4842 stop:5096 length:255 start_codon:yes stop_codon:yes gene_type:complete
MYKAKEIKFTYDSKTLLSKKDEEIKKDIINCKNILKDLLQIQNIREKHEAKHNKWWDDRKKFSDDWMNLIDKLNYKLIKKNKLT